MPNSIAPAVHRIEVHHASHDRDAHAAALLTGAKAALPGTTDAKIARIYLIEAALSPAEVARIGAELLADPINQVAVVGATAACTSNKFVEVHYKPGVMDPVAQSTREAICEMLPRLNKADVSVMTGARYTFAGCTAPDADLTRFALSRLGNGVIQAAHLTAYHPSAFPHGTPALFKLRHVELTTLSHAGLEKLSREGHLFLSLEEMLCIQNYYKTAGREPTDIELESLAQTWSEHCVHKTLKSRVSYKAAAGNGIFNNADGTLKKGHELQADGTIVIHNLLKQTVAKATFDLMDADAAMKEWCVSVFVDNAGIVKFDDEDGVCIKVETHNHPSAIEPYGGAATGIGGCIRDIMGTGLSAKPIANTDVFCVAHPDFDPALIPTGVIHPRRTLEQVVAGVRDYGNRMGIPTVNGAVYFHDDYLANPLVYCGCVGILPLDKCHGAARPGDKIVILGGETGRDGIHGATFSSEELEHTASDEFSHAVQIGNAITEKRTMDILLQCRDWQDPKTGEKKCLFTKISDCGAGGFSSAVGEMSEKVGAVIELDQAPLKYQGLTYTEVWISEAQERMPLAVPPENVDIIRKMCAAEGVPFCVLGTFGYQEAGQPTLKLMWHGKEVGKLPMHLLHDGVPTPTRAAEWAPQDMDLKAPKHAVKTTAVPATTEGSLLAILSHPNVASKHWVIRGYDHEVQGGSVVKPLVGPKQDGPSDGAVVRPKLRSNRAIALACGMAPNLAEKSNKPWPGHAKALASDGDSYHAVLNAIDEAVRNVVCVGADPARIAILDNFSWPKCADPKQLGTLVRAAEACYDGAMAYKTPFVSGKDSLSNQFATDKGEVITIPQTMLITAMGMVNDANKARTMDLKKAGSALILVGKTHGDLGGSLIAALQGITCTIPKVDLAVGPKNARAVAGLIAGSGVLSAHDLSDGGLLVAAAEMAFAGCLGIELDLTGQPIGPDTSLRSQCFSETPSRYLLEVETNQADAVLAQLKADGVVAFKVGSVVGGESMVVKHEGKELMRTGIETLRGAWRKTLDW